MAQRIKGQEVSAAFISATAGLEDSVSEVKSFELQYDRDIMSEGYIGQTTEQKDDIFKGVSGSLEFHATSGTVFDLIQRINDKSRNRTPGEVFQIAGTFTFPDGTRRRIIVRDPAIGNIPVSTSSRGDYVSFKFDFAADDATLIAA